MSFLLSLDQGTTSSRAIVFDAHGQTVALSQSEFAQHYPNEGWVEHDPNDIWQTTLESAQKALSAANLDASDIQAIGITNQRETTLVWDKKTGEPVYPAIVWQDRRTSDVCAWLKSDPNNERNVNQLTGLCLDPYFSATKIAWILDHVDGARARAQKGELAFGTVDTFLLWKLTKGEVHATDATNASRTSLFNIHTQTWDDELLALFNIPAALLPDVRDSAADFGHAHSDWLGSRVPICAIIGDQQSALVGQACINVGMAKSTYGTGGFMMANTGAQAVQSQHQLLATVAYRINGTTTYALEGSIFMAGASIQWLRDTLTLISNTQETQTLAEQHGYEHNVMVVPAFQGLGAPYWDADARGAILGLSRGSGIAEIVTATLQSTAYQSRDLAEAMADDGVALNHLRVDGGMSSNRWFVQCLSDVLNIPIEMSHTHETTALGAAFLAGLHAGVYTRLDDIQTLWKCETQNTPELDEPVRERMYTQWQQAVKRIKSGHVDHV